MDKIKQFENERIARIDSYANKQSLIESAYPFLKKTLEEGYSYNFSWMGRPIIQYPQDMIAMQELIWEVKPDLIIETGIAHGGSLVFYASMLELIGNGSVLGIDIEIRPHNRAAIEAHPMFKRIEMIEGSSVSEDTLAQVREKAKGKAKIMVVLDSNHTHEHVLAELNLYHEFVSLDSYLVVFDTVVEDMPADYDWSPRPWGKGNNPKTAVWEFLKNNNSFEIQKHIDNKLLISVAPDGYLKKVR
jgi:cephalosporin hydroxylase